MLSVLKEKSYHLAVQIVFLVQFLQNEKKEFVMSRQLLKSGTAVGALLREAVFAQSESDYLNKLSVGLKEANETDFWLNLLKDTGYVIESQIEDLMSINKELIAILSSCVKTLNRKLKHN